MQQETSQKIIRDTEKGYDAMADKFSGTRSFFWPDLTFIKDHISPNSRVLDFGCGNGRLLEILKDKDVDYYGVDISENLIAIARDRYPQFAAHIAKNSAEPKLNFPDNFFDVVISIAVFHHSPSAHYRLALAEELYRVTKPGGKIIVTVWNLWQKRYRKHIWKNAFEKIIGRSDLDFKDCEIPFKNNTGQVFTRFHHAYTEGELAELFENAGFSEVTVRTVKNKNLVLIGKK